ncbi:MAG TPA: hypothetical protein VHQ00_15785 [Chloroflexota bacterium]|nr:hypothetical protein [Chloroflexota bacterium]
MARLALLPGARGVVELPAGMARRTQTEAEAGDVLDFDPPV